jgi:hypothetical protein
MPKRGGPTPSTAGRVLEELCCRSRHLELGIRSQEPFFVAGISLGAIQNELCGWGPFLMAAFSLGAILPGRISRVCRGRHFAGEETDGDISVSGVSARDP